MGETQSATAGFEDRRKAQVKDCGQPLEAEKITERNCPRDIRKNALILPQ